MKIKNLIFGQDIEIKKTFFKYGIWDQASIVVVLAAVIPTLHSYFGSRKFFIKNFSANFQSTSDVEYYAVLYFFFSALLLMGIIPALLIKYSFKKKLSDFGLNLGNYKLGFRLILILFPIIAIFFLIPAAFQEEIKQFYPFYKPGLDDHFIFLRMELLRGILFYFAWEFFFRGFILFGLREYVGDWLAILIQTVPSCLWHIGYPTGEIVMSIPAGIMFGIITVRTNSIIYPFILHWFIGIFLNFLLLITR